MDESQRETSIAVVGVAAVFPESANAETFWQHIVEGDDLLSDVPPSRWHIGDYYEAGSNKPHKVYSKRGGFIPDLSFSPGEYGLPPETLKATDPSQLLALVVASDLLRDVARGDASLENRDRICIILGATLGTYLGEHMGQGMGRPIWAHALRTSGLSEDETKKICDRISEVYLPWQENTFPGLLGNVIAGRVANRMDLGGTNCTVDAACAGTFAALKYAISELLLGEADLAITGGIDALNSPLSYMCFCKTYALSISDNCQPFSAQADGTLLGEGAGMFALRRLSDAERLGDRIYGVIKAIGSSSDGRAKSIYAPLPEGQMKALNRAFKKAQIEPHTVELVEAHGTGTIAGDAAEFESLQAVYGEKGNGSGPWCALGSIKSQIGHTKAAAGAAGLFKALMALHHQVLPPTIKIEGPNPNLALDKSPFYLNLRKRPWIAKQEHPRRAAVSAFGFGGTNFHVLLEEYRGPGKKAYRLAAYPCALWVWSATNMNALHTQCQTFLEHLDLEGLPAQSAWATQQAFHADETCRLAVVAKDHEALRHRLSSMLPLLKKGVVPGKCGPGIYFSHEIKAGKIAFLFPGQGSQYLHMGLDQSIFFEPVKEIWEKAAVFDWDPANKLHEIVYPQTVFDKELKNEQNAHLTRTDWAQPAIAALSWGLFRTLKMFGVDPDIVAGHSFGEITALCAADVFRDDQLLEIARQRGVIMAQASDMVGGMTSVCACEEKLMPILQDQEALSIANYNAPEQCVVSGKEERLIALEQTLQNEGISFKRLPVAAAFHSPLMAPSVAPFKDFLDTISFQEPRIPVFANTTAESYPNIPGEMRALLAQQLRSPVRFKEQIERLYEEGVRTFVEVGPHSLLSGLVQKTLASRDNVSIIPTDHQGANGFQAFMGALGQLAVRGIPIAFDALWKDCRPFDENVKEKTPFKVRIGGGLYAKPERPEINPRDKGPVSQEAVPAMRKEERQAPAGQAFGTNTTPDTSRATIPNRVQKPGTTVFSDARSESYQEHQKENEAKKIPHSTSSASEPISTATDTNAWLQAFQQFQEQTIATHQAFQKQMAETQQTFLRVADRSFQRLAALLSGERVDAEAPLNPVDPLPREDPEMVSSSEGVPQKELIGDQLKNHLEMPGVSAATAMQAPPPTLPSTADPVLDALSDQRMEPPMVAPAADAPVVMGSASVAAEETASVLSDEEFRALLLDTVAEKTGYPQEMLELDMELEADLGIDSIKRVDIFSALSEKVPVLKQVELSEEAEFRTLNHIIARFTRAKSEEGGTDAAVDEPEGPALSNDASGDEDKEPANRLSRDQLLAELIGVASRVTGYPEDLIKPDMELAADLGMDQPQQQAFLQELQQRGTWAPEEVLVTPTDENRVTIDQMADVMLAKGATHAQSEDPFTVSTPSARTISMKRYVLQNVPRSPDGFSLAFLRRCKELVIFDDFGGIAQALSKTLKAHGIGCCVVQAIPQKVDGAILLHGLRKISDVDSALGIHREAFQVARALSNALAASPGVFITVQNTGGDFGFSHADELGGWMGGIAALTKTVFREWPAVHVKALDVERADLGIEEVAQRIAHELLSGGPELEVGIRADGTRTTPILVEEEAVDGGSTFLKPNDVIVVTGGARGVTAATLRALVKTLPLRIALLGRTPYDASPDPYPECEDVAALNQKLLDTAKNEGEKISPKALKERAERVMATREIRHTLETLEQEGASVTYFPVDIREAKALAGVLKKVRQKWGSPQGIIHGAGVLADAWIAKKSDEQFDRVFSTKVTGLRHLLNLTKDDPLKHIILYGSVAARFGNAGQCDYAMANELLNKVARGEERRRKGTCVVRSINWGPWASGMVNETLRKEFDKRGVDLIPVDQGTEALVQEYSMASSHVEVLWGAGNGQSRHLFPTDREVNYDLHISQETFPFLSSHRIQDNVVIPAVQVLSWFVDAGRYGPFFGSGTRFACSDFKMLKGIRCPHFEGLGDDLELSFVCEDLAKGEVRAQCMDAEGHLCYQAMLRNHAGTETQPSEVPRLDEFEGRSPWNERVHYNGDLLFHGPALQVIAAIEAVSKQGIRARLMENEQTAWARKTRGQHVAFLDGAMQMMVLWGLFIENAYFLPTGIHSYVVPLEDEFPAELIVQAKAISHDRAKLVMDIFFQRLDGQLLCTMEGVTFHAAPQL